MTREEIVFLKSLTNKIDDLTDCDVSAVLKLAQHHSVLPLCYENLSGAKGFCEENYVNFRNRALGNAVAQAKRNEYFKKIYRVLLNAGLKPVVVKGIVLRNLYGEQCNNRPSGDEDIIIKKEEFFKVNELLVANGYVADTINVTDKVLDNIQEITYSNELTKLKIEVHLNPLGTENKVRTLLNKYFKGFHHRIVKLNIDGAEIYTLDYTEHYIYLFFHFIRHISSGVGVRQMLDMYKFLEAYSAYIDKDRVKEAIAAIGGKKLYADVIEIGNRYMGFSFDPLFDVFDPERLLNSVLKTGTFGNTTGELSGSRVLVSTAIQNGQSMSRFGAIFPSVTAIRSHYTILYNHPYLLPFVWIWRIFRYIFRVVTGKKTSLSKSEKIAEERIKLLKDYNII